MEKKGTSVFSNGLIWFGAGVSLAEILTGTYFAPLGFGKAMAAILLGHLIGGLMMFAAGMIGAKERKSAMETVKMSFGERGSLLFAVLNVLQLVGCNYPPKIAEAEIKPVSQSGEIVLSRVVVPEFVVVHDGAPTDSTAGDYYVRY